MRRAIVIAVAGLVVGTSRQAVAGDDRRIAVATMDGRSGLNLRLGAEVAELGYKVVAFSADETRDGAVLADALERVDAVAALTLEVDEGAVVACVVERASMHRTCRQVAASDHALDDGAIATKSVELLRALLIDQPERVTPALEPEVAEKTSPAREADNPSPRPAMSRAHRSIVAGRFGPGIFVTSGVPAEVVAGVGLEWISVPHFAIGVDGSLPISGSTIDRSEGSSSIRVSTVTLHADGRVHSGRVEGELGAGLGLMWLQANGTVANVPSTPGTNGFSGVSASLVDPFVALHAAGVFFLDRAVALRLDVTGAYAIQHAAIVFGSEQVASVGRPMMTSTLSIALAWP